VRSDPHAVRVGLAKTRAAIDGFTRLNASEFARACAVGVVTIDDFRCSMNSRPTVRPSAALIFMSLNERAWNECPSRVSVMIAAGLFSFASPCASHNPSPHISATSVHRRELHALRIHRERFPVRPSWSLLMRCASWSALFDVERKGRCPHSWRPRRNRHEKVSRHLPLQFPPSRGAQEPAPRS